MTINKLTAGSKGNPFNSRGRDVANAVNALIDQQSGLSAESGVFVWDDFDAENELLNGRVTPSGHVWSVSGPGASIASITNKAMLNNGGNIYPSLQYGQQVVFMSGVFSFVAGTINSGPQVVLIMQDESLDLLDMLHLQITPTKWTLDKRIGGVWTNGVIGQEHDLALNGTPYWAGMERRGSDLIIYTPDGKEVVYSDPDVSTMDLKAGTWQIQTVNANQWTPRWHNINMGERKASFNPLMQWAGSAGEIARVAGYGLGKRKSTQFKVTADGWYRVAYHTTVDAFTIRGTIKIATTGFFASTYHANIIAKSGETPSVDPVILAGGYQMPNVRVGTDSNGAYIDVQIANSSANAANVTLTIDCEGFVNLYPSLISSPVTPAKTVTTAVVKPATTSTSGIITTNGWVRIASQTTGSGGYHMDGIVRIKATDIARVAVLDVLISAKSDNSLKPIQINNCVGRNAPINQIRLSRGVNTINLEVNAVYAATNNLSLQCDFFGLFTPDLAFTTGLSPLSTESIARSITLDRQQTIDTKIYAAGDETIRYTTAADGGTVDILDGEGGVHQTTPSIAALTVNLPPNPVNGQITTVASVNVITTLTVNASNSKIGTFSISAAGGAEYAFRFRSSNNTWYRVR